jgi:hypothetical protein
VTFDRLFLPFLAFSIFMKNASQVMSRREKQNYFVHDPVPGT